MLASACVYSAYPYPFTFTKLRQKRRKHTFSLVLFIATPATTIEQKSISAMEALTHFGADPPGAEGDRDPRRPVLQMEGSNGVLWAVRGVI
jgi:hypothetical protein